MVVGVAGGGGGSCKGGGGGRKGGKGKASPAVDESQGLWGGCRRVNCLILGDHTIVSLHIGRKDRPRGSEAGYGGPKTGSEKKDHPDPDPRAEEKNDPTVRFFASRRSDSDICTSLSNP